MYILKPVEEARINAAWERIDAGEWVDHADEQDLPFEAKIPNAETQKAIAELESGAGHKSYSVAELMADLHADD